MKTRMRVLASSLLIALAPMALAEDGGSLGTFARLDPLHDLGERLLRETVSLHCRHTHCAHDGLDRG